MFIACTIAEIRPSEGVRRKTLLTDCHDAVDLVSRISRRAGVTHEELAVMPGLKPSLSARTG